jgi:hypothetical protein
MFTCKQVSKALSNEDYKNLPPLRRFFLRLHVRLCVFCGKYNLQVMDSQDMCRCYKEHELSHEEAFTPHRPKMESAKKDRLKKLLASQSK